MDIFKSRFLSSHPWLVYGVSTKKYHDLRIIKEGKQIIVNDNLKLFCQGLRFSPSDLVVTRQIHSHKVFIAGVKDKGKVIGKGDGLVTKEKTVILGISIADCLPIFFLDPVSRIIGLAHCGWKGTMKKIVKNMICSLSQIGALKNNLVISIGPHIGQCCYSIPDERARLFKKKFKDVSAFLELKDSKYYLDLAALNVKILLESKVPKSHIEISKICTSCGKDMYFSRRGDKNEKGLLLAVMGLKNHE